MKKRVILSPAVIEQIDNPYSGPFVSSANYRPTIGQLFTYPSEIQRNQSMSLSEIFTKFHQGQALPQLNGFVYPDIDTSDFDGLSRFEKIDTARRIADDLLAERTRIYKAAQDKASADLKAAIDKQIEDGVAARMAQQPVNS